MRRDAIRRTWAQDEFFRDLKFFVMRPTNASVLPLVGGWVGG